MIIQHNMAAANANRMLGSVVTSQSKSTEKLSSGYRINRAADDAAGLSISEKMRGQIRGLDQASTNAQDGISMIQTAEGALNESHSILQRMRELAVQASNGTETDDDRDAVQDEIEQLQEELDRIASDTEFNTMKLLDGSRAGSETDVAVGTTNGSLTAGTPATKQTWNSITLTDSDGESALDSVSIKIKIGSGTEQTITSTAGKTLDGTVTADLVSKLNNTAGFKDTYKATVVSDGKIKIEALTAGEVDSTKELTQINSAPVAAADTAGADEVAATFNQTNADTTGAANVTTVGGQKFAYIQESKKDDVTVDADVNVIYTEAATISNDDAKKMADLVKKETGLNVTAPATGTSIELAAGTKETGGVNLHVGANENQIINFSIDKMDSASLGVGKAQVNCKTATAAESAITTIDNAIKKVSTQRSSLGAKQNRLEHTIANLDTSSENLQTAESRIRDVDMATEMVTYSKNNILQQAAQSMLAQANQSTQGVLSLLQ